MKLLDIYPGDGKPTQQEKDIFNDVLDRVKTYSPLMVELGCYNAYWSLVFRERFPNGYSFINDIDDEHLQVGITNFELNELHCYGHCGSVVEFIEYHNWVFDRIIDVLHMDIQGAELDFLQRSNINNVKNIVVATHSQKLHNQCKALLKDFTIHVDLPFGTIGGDGFLVGGRI